MTTPPDIVRAAYVDLVVTDLARARKWWVDLIGFHVQLEEPGALYLRGYEEFIHHSVTLREGPEAACARMGFRVRTPDDVDRAQRYFDEKQLYAAWMFRKQTVHDVAFTLGSGPMIHHIAFAVPESHNIFSLCDTIGALDLQASVIERGPGRHGVSNAFYLYMRDPDGHRVEIYTTDYFTGDPGHQPIRWDVHDERRRDFWGNAVVPSWYLAASGLLDLDGHPTPVHDQPVTERTVKVGADGLG
jgi:catechol 2,3-dioxygenase-like lactoylglutathione lyase family enzyme